MYAQAKYLAGEKVANKIASCHATLNASLPSAKRHAPPSSSERRLLKMAQTIDKHMDHEHNYDHVSPFESAAWGLSITDLHPLDHAADAAHVPSYANNGHRGSLTNRIKNLFCFKAHVTPVAGNANMSAYLQKDSEAHVATVMSEGSRAAEAAASSKQHRRSKLCSCWGDQHAAELQSKHSSYHSVDLQTMPWLQRISPIKSVVEWFEAHSMFSNEIHIKESFKQQPTLKQQHTEQQGQWVPDTPLLFADQELHFVPVPKVTGFAGYWEVDEQQSTPYPLPLHDLIGASKLVRKIHKSMAGMEIKETESQLTIGGQPTFIPPGFPAKYCETYDKTNLNPCTWTPRRDLKLGSCSGKIYMTDAGMLVLRVESRTAFRSTVDYIVEDYITLEEDGRMIKDRMCCYDVATGRRAEQLQVGRLRSV